MNDYQLAHVPEDAPLPNPPFIDSRLVEWLERVFTPLAIRPTTPTNDIMFNAGQQTVVEAIRRLREANSGRGVQLDLI